MGVQIPAGYAQLVYEFSLEGTTHRPTFTMGLNPDPGLSATDIAQLGDDAITGTGSLMSSGAVVIDGWALVAVHATLMTESGPLLGDDTSGMVGTATASALPINCALLVSKNTSRGGRKGRGRFYCPPFTIAEGGVDPIGTIGGGDLSAFQAKCDAFFALLDGVDSVPVLLHEDGSLPDQITSLSAQAIIATQRRRMR